MMRFSCILFVLLILTSPVSCESRRIIQYESVSQFLFSNAKLCGDPFSDAVWLPVLDLCTIECDVSSQYCVENEELAQQCKTLPDECQAVLKKSLRHIQKRHSRSHRNLVIS